MNKIYLYTIWQKVNDLIQNPELPVDFVVAPGMETFQVPVDKIDPDDDSPTTMVDLPIWILDPHNPSHVRYQAIKVVHDITVAREICSAPGGQFVYTISEGFFGNDYDG